MTLRSLVGLCLLLALTACSSNKKKDELKRSDLVDFDASVKVKAHWDKGISSGRDQRASNLVSTLDGNILYLADVGGRVFALDLETKKYRWKINVGKDISAGTGIYGDSVYLGTFKGELIALDVETGEQRWVAKASSEILSVPAANRSVVVVQTIDGRVFGFSSSSGEKLWQYDHPVPALTLRGTANPVISRNQVFAAFGNGQIVSLNIQDGSLLWGGRVSSPRGRHDLEKMVDIDGTAVVDDGLVYAATYQGALATFSKAKGQVIWKQDLSSYRNLAVDATQVYAVTEESHLVAFDAANGNILWTNEQMQLRNLGIPLVFDEYVLVADDDNYLHVLDKRDGSFVGRKKLNGDTFSAPLVIMNEQFLALSDDGHITVYSLKK